MERDYKSAYEHERLRNADLAEKVAELEDKNRELQAKVDHIKEHPLWKLSTPARKSMHWVIRQRDRIRNQGSLRGVLAKVRYKMRERKAYSYYGTSSFPSEETIKAQRETVFDKPVKISILTPLYNTPEKFLRDMIESVMNQTYENWQLCLADGSDDEHSYVGEVCREYADKDAALRNGRSRITYQKLTVNDGISGNTNECLKLATGEYIGLLDHDDILHPEALYTYVKAINEEGADYIYCDETTFVGGNIDKMATMHFKPDYGVDTLRANNYICHFSVFKRTLLEGTELFRKEFDGSQDHDMILRLTDAAGKIVHVPRILYYWRSHAGSVASGIEAKTYAIEAARGAVADHLRRHGYKNFKITSTRAFETIFKISYEIEGTPKISIVIPNREHADDLKRCIRSIYEKSTWDNYEIIVVENGSKGKEILDYYDELKTAPWSDFVKVVDYKEGGAFNYSRIVNYGVSHASGEYIILLNNDVEVISVNWMEELLMYAQRSDVGAVGAKLYFPDRKIQHAGVVLGLGAHRTAGHSHYGQEGMNLGYMGRLCYAQNVSAVTGACLMVSRQDYDSVGGLDESFEVSLNDVDFCLKLREKGLLNVFTPFAELTHYESASRGLDLQGENAARYDRESEKFRTKWKKVLEKGDPYYNPNFSLDRSDFSINIEGHGSAVLGDH
ncbi:glycosyltransferase family 2 protein [Butyrivibrio sp. MC2013]|uniref:glycosyltransferase family 2 protein n=1 Tax=Butyrivibrio sp. MC2013 TaxID=1280686 RepID=UPI000420A6A3|nr:glycosyltransferase family 2 protein [Butyrivibrio sp. MC2013]